MGMMVASLQEGGNSPVSQILLENSLEGTEEKPQENALKSGNVFGMGQELCHGIHLEKTLSLLQFVITSVAQFTNWTNILVPGKVCL